MKKTWLKKKQVTEFVEVQGAKVYLKPLTYGMSRKANTIAMKINLATQEVDLDANLLALLRVVYQIADWDLTDEEDNKLPIKLETFDEILDEDFVNELIQAVNDAAESVSAEEKK